MTPRPALCALRWARARRLAALLAVSAVVMACTTVMDGTAKPAEPPGISATPTTARPSVVPASEISGKLLTRDELGAIIGDTELTEAATYTEPKLYFENVEPEACGVRVMENGINVLDGTERAALAGNSSAGAAGKYAGQVVTIWPSAKTATDRFDFATFDWEVCKDGQSFTVTLDNETQQWTAGPVAVTEARMTTSAQRAQPTPRSCAHVLARHWNVMVETKVCAREGDTMGAANQIADTILAKFPS